MDSSKISIIFMCNGLLFIILGIPLYLKKIKPNGIYGFRTEKTMSDPNIWYAVNRTGGIDMCIAGLVIILGSLLSNMFLKSYPSSTILCANVALLTFALVMVIIHFIVVLNRY
jgi:uncharacterized membrane protein